MAEEPDEAWVAEHLEVTSLDDEHGGGVAVEVASLAWEAEADVDVAKTGAWLQAHGGEVKAFEASWSACAVCVCAVHLWNAHVGCLVVVAAVWGGCAQRWVWVHACTRWHEAWGHARR